MEKNDFFRYLREKKYAKAFELLYYDNYTDLFKYAYGILRSEEKAKDVVQTVFSKLWERRERLDIDERVGAYLARAVYYGAINQIRKEKTERMHEEGVRDELYSRGVFSDSAVETNELRERLAQALDTLPEHCREVFCLSRFTGLKRKEIADKLGISVKTVDTQIYRALKKMRSFLGNDSF
ncbi:RNA polymerase sigma-70 factor [Fulvitalea axinellae]|uniref:RNA polymerase sigma-70 factor n=1 Tax=Fulvitalea axinellae TaxID=1182444 RepID=UPI0030CA1F0C